ncbi:MAG TPA: sensor histidine kinase, partial [Anaerolineaceae bacterium]|nr:sensor histidine kinase [Anaerolineaceae bacterium]
LTLIRFNVEQALSMSYPNPSLEQIMRQISIGVESGIDELRDLCNQLRPPTLAPYGLEKAIRSHAREIRNRYVAPLIELDLDPDRQRIPAEFRTALFRIYQESMTNAIKHAKAGEVKVTLRLNERWVELTVSDDGVGFKQPAHWVEFARRQHFGLMGMQERAEALGGTLEVRSAVGVGTTVRARIPIPGAGEQARNSPAAP